MARKKITIRLGDALTLPDYFERRFSDSSRALRLISGAFVLFFFTDASAWAENLTSVNRVLLQIVPATERKASPAWPRAPTISSCAI